MPKTLTIEIETDDEDRLYLLLNHVFREITEGKEYSNQEIESNYKFDWDWLEVVEGKYKGKYKWIKEV